MPTSCGYSITLLLRSYYLHLSFLQSNCVLMVLYMSVCLITVSCHISLGVRDDKGQSSLSKACSRVFIHSECPDIALYLINLGCECSQEEKAKLLIGTSGWGRVEVLKELIEKHNFQFGMSMYCSLVQYSWFFFRGSKFHELHRGFLLVST